MEAMMNVLPHNSVEELHTFYRTETNARLARRIHVVWLARRGMSCPQIMEVTGAGRRSIQLWVARYNAGGVDELVDKPRTGRPPLLSPPQQEQLKAWVQAGPSQDDLVSAFSAAVTNERVEQEFGVLYSLRGMQYLLGRLGFSYQCPRPRHENSDPQAQEEFKKNSRPCWLKFKPTTPENESRSTSKTKRGSASKAR
jgi:transposase